MLNHARNNIINTFMWLSLLVCAGCTSVGSADAPDSHNEPKAGLASEASTSLDVIDPGKSVLVTFAHTTNVGNSAYSAGNQCAM